VVGVGDEVGEREMVGDKPGVIVAPPVGEGWGSVAQAPDPIFTFAGFTKESTSSVGSSDGARENTRERSESNWICADPAVFGLKVIVATLLTV